MLYPLYDRLIQPSIQLAADFSHRGIKLDVPLIKKLTQQYKEKQKEIAEKIYQQFGIRFNINSSKQILEIVYTKLGITENDVELTDKGFLSTSKETIEKLAEKYPDIKPIIEYRHLDHDISNYFSKPLLLMDSSHVVHPDWNPTGTETGRWTCTNPAIQTYHKGVKSTIIPHSGNIFVGGDFSQAEMRILGWYSQDPLLLSSIDKDIDLHITNGSAFFNKDLNEFQNNYKKEINEGIKNGEWYKLRQKAKTLGFLLVYRGKEGAIMHSLNTNYQNAKEIRTNYFKNFKTVMPWSDDIIKQMKKNKQLVSAFGRIRHYQHIDFNTMVLKDLGFGKTTKTYKDPQAYHAEKEGPNFMIQGTSVDYVNFNLIRTQKELKKIKGYCVLQVHDSGLFEIPEKFIDQGIEIIKENMVKDVPPVDIKMKLDLEIGENYGDMTEIS